jgi:N-acetylglutamate synthase
MIATLEEISLNALPALQTLFYDGWIVRMAKGYTRRANSVQTFGVSSCALAEKIAYCESLYRKNDLAVVFKMTPASQPVELDGYLAKRGYQYEAGTLVQTADLTTFDGGDTPLVQISETWNDVWFSEYLRMNQTSTQSWETLKQLLQLILPKTAFAMVVDSDGVRACGLGVAQNNFVGLYDIVVDGHARRRGYGKQLVGAIMDWGKRQGARTAYLQVLANNEPALQLYEQLGFVEQYSYWYRTRV